MENWVCWDKDSGQFQHYGRLRDSLEGLEEEGWCLACGEFRHMRGEEEELPKKKKRKSSWSKGRAKDHPEASIAPVQAVFVSTARRRQPAVPIVVIRGRHPDVLAIVSSSQEGEPVHCLHGVGPLCGQLPCPPGGGEGAPASQGDYMRLPPPLQEGDYLQLPPPPAEGDYLHLPSPPPKGDYLPLPPPPHKGELHQFPAAKGEPH
ncbi:UNVERIFIED_CONTAM: hypothetical protein FKN15_052658 [Acipenser sinensis]